MLRKPFFIAIEPVPKGRPRFTRSGFAYTPEKTQHYEDSLSWMIKSIWKEPPSEGPLSLELNFYLKPPASSKRKEPFCKPDLDNLIKSFLDSANKILFLDDSQIIEMHSRKLYDRKTLRIGLEFTLKQFDL